MRICLRILRIVIRIICRLFAILVSIIDFIEKLQKKPRHVRVQIMWVAVAVCMIFIFVFWVWSLPKLSQPDEKSAAEQEKIIDNLKQLKNDVPTLWQSLGAGIGSIFESVKQGLENQPSNSSSAPQNPVQERLPVE